ncbi:MAG TPA: hypothetical protein VL096_09510, partial [Pirellulaceae bacterium]|nr:hypothetical protein [Pirellulaceae bacterium]
MPAVIERRWTSEVPHPRRWRVFSLRSRQLLILLCTLLLTSGVLAGIVAWWQPITAPIWVVLAISRPDTATTTRGLEIAGDAYAYRVALKPDHRAVLRDSGITRRECELLLSRLRSTRSQDRLCFYIAATVTVNGLGEVVLFPSDIGPTEVEAALPLVDLITAIANSGANRSVIWLDLSPVDSDDPEVSPVVGTGLAVQNLLKRLSLNGTLVITSTAPGQTPERVPATCRSAFGLFFEHGLLGAADGCGNSGLVDGRISVNELTAYLLARVPAFTAAACGHQQTPVCYGSVPDFELSIGSTDLPALAVTRNSEPYPKWLQESWTEYQTALTTESYHADIPSFRAWTSALVAAETAWCNQAPSNLVADLQNQLAEAQKQFQNQMLVVARDTLVADTAEFRQAVQDVESFLATLEQQLESATPDQAKALPAKLIGDFTKAQAKTPDVVIVAAILAVAERPATSAPTPLTTLVRLLDAFPKATETDRTTLLRTLAALSKRVDASSWKPEGAQKLMMIAHCSERVVGEVAHWPWTKSALDTLWSHRVSGEVLLLARGYAPIDVAWNRIQRTGTECTTLQLCTTALHRACRLRGEASAVLPAHVIYAQQNAALTDTWITAALALHELNLGLVPPTSPPHDADDLRQMVDTLSRHAAMLQNQIDTLKRPLAGDMLNLAVSECQAANADAQDLIHTECLLSSPLLSTADRERLTKSYHQLADRLVAAALTLDTIDDSNATSVSERSAVIASRAQIAKSWQGNGATSLARTVSQQTAIQNNRDAWYTAAKRYREAQWQRVLASDQPGSKSAPAWSLADVSILGPLSCDELNRQQTRAMLSVAWLARHDSQAPMTVQTFTPSEQLKVTPLEGTSRNGDAVQLNLHWRGSLETPARARVEGFLLELTGNDRSYFAAISLPHLNDQSEVALALSSTPDICTPLSSTIELRPSGTPQSIYVFATNTTTQARGLLLRQNGTTLGEPCTLAPQETKRLAIAALPPGLNGPVTPLHWEALDSTTMEVLGQRTYAVEVRNPADAAEVIDAQFTSDSNQGVTATVNLQALPKAANAPVDAVLVFTRSDNSLPIRILGGRLQGTLSGASGHLSLSATGMQVSPGDRLQCSVTLDGVPRVFELTGTVP